VFIWVDLFDKGSPDFFLSLLLKFTALQFVKQKTAALFICGRTNCKAVNLDKKVFGKGFGEEPFLRKVFPDKPHITILYKQTLWFHIRYVISCRLL
jgi:hypothetical protein